MSIIYEPHACVKPRENQRMAPLVLAPLHHDGAIWQCGVCALYWRYVVYPGYYGEWRRVRFWNLRAKHRIRKAHR